MSTRTDFTVAMGADEWVVCALEEPAEPWCLVLICHGLTGDMFGPGGIQRDLAATLVADGAAVVRLETRGAGDASRSADHPVMSSMVEDIGAVLDAAPLRHLRRLPLVLCGMSLGALAVAEAARGLESARGVVSISSDLADGDRRPWPVNWSRAAEHALPGAFMADLAGFRPRGALLARRVPVAVVVGGQDRGAETVPELRAEGVEVDLVPGADHLFRDAAARARLFRSVSARVRQFAARD
ncbi:alpha/beta hydrolase [Micromonospora sp. DT62]|uniref:alpha/beta hydrolase n=1 Tax=Micromonospora sp. DT62 TaxID=3416521 RepID=UPI003CFA3659